jgi:hypothetical protein
MKTIIQLTMVILGCVVLVNGVIFIKDLELGFSSDALTRIPFVAIPSLGIFYLYRRYTKLVEKAEDELKKKIEQETLLALNNTEDFELQPTLSYLILLFLGIVLLGVAPLYFGIKLMPVYTDSGMTILFSVLIILGLFFGVGLLHAFFLMAGKPIIRINQRGISHFMIDFIDWKDVTGIYLQTLETQGGAQHSLEVCVQNPHYYNPRHKSLFGRFRKKEQISLPLPVSNENARIAESVAVAFAKRANAPLLYFPNKPICTDEFSKIIA